jgi:hypothetical protein
MGGLLDYVLNRTEIALQLFRQHVVLDEQLSEEQQLWLYALLSAGLLKGIGKLYTEYRIVLFNRQRVEIKKWEPLAEPMNLVGHSYLYELQGHQDDELRRRLNLLLAPQLMPCAGFSWIASNKEVLAIWLALLEEENSSSGTLDAILDRADAIAIQQALFEHVPKNTAAGVIGNGNRIGTFLDVPVELSVEEEQAMAVEFIKWVEHALSEGKFVINQPPFVLVAGGMLMTPEVFKFFARFHPDYKNWLAIQKGFLALGLHAKNPNGDPTVTITHENKRLTGILVEKFEIMLPNELYAKETHAGENRHISALELISQASAQPLLQLSTTGHWERMQDAPSEIQFRSRPNG